MKCNECGGPCRPRDLEKVGRRIGGGGRSKRKSHYKKHQVCDFCRHTADNAYALNVLREEIRNHK